jgi:hypothetical protein
VHSGQIYDDEYQNLVLKRAQLMQEVTGVLSKTRQLETEIERLETDIQKTGNF